MDVPASKPDPAQFNPSGYNDGRLTGKEPPLPLLIEHVYHGFISGDAEAFASETLHRRCVDYVVRLCNEVGTVNAVKIILGELKPGDIGL